LLAGSTKVLLLQGCSLEEGNANRLDDKERTDSGNPSGLHLVYREASKMAIVKCPEKPNFQKIKKRG
jgi:hypothetical protein